jgi:hypothetical protein
MTAGLRLEAVGLRTDVPSSVPSSYSLQPAAYSLFRPLDASPESSAPSAPEPFKNNAP